MITKVGAKSFNIDCNGTNDFLTDISFTTDNYNWNLYNMKFKCKSNTTYEVPIETPPSDAVVVKSSNIDGFNSINVYNDVWARKNRIDSIDIFGNNKSDLKWGSNILYGSEINCPAGSSITGI